MKARHAIVIAGISLFSTGVMAGKVQPADVVVTTNGDGSGGATGDMVTARFADNDAVYIGCGFRTYDDGAGGSFQFGFCQAEDDAGRAGFCSTERQDLLEAMKATSDYAFVTFRWDAAGECDHIGFSTQSFYISDKKAK